MNDQTLRDLYRRHLSSRQVDREHCPPVEAIEAMVNRSGNEADRLATLDHVMSCPGCRHDFDLIRTAAEAARVSTRPRFRVPIALAASLLVLVAGRLLWSLLRQDEPVIRGAPAEVTLLSPADGSTVPDSVRLVWGSVADAFQYQVEVLEEDGVVRYRKTARDTTATVPGDSLVPGRSYVWWVRADLTVAGGRRSVLRRFSVRTP